MLIFCWCLEGSWGRGTSVCSPVYGPAECCRLCSCLLRVGLAGSLAAVVQTKQREEEGERETFPAEAEGSGSRWKHVDLRRIGAADSGCCGRKHGGGPCFFYYFYFHFFLPNVKRSCCSVSAADLCVSVGPLEQRNQTNRTCFWFDQRGKKTLLLSFFIDQQSFRCDGAERAELIVYHEETV